MAFSAKFELHRPARPPKSTSLRTHHSPAPTLGSKQTVPLPPCISKSLEVLLLTLAFLGCVCGGVIFTHFLLQYNCFMMLCYFLLYKEVNHLRVYTYPFLLTAPSHSGILLSHKNEMKLGHL